LAGQVSTARVVAGPLDGLFAAGGGGGALVETPLPEGHPHAVAHPLPCEARGDAALPLQRVGELAPRGAEAADGPGLAVRVGAESDGVVLRRILEDRA